MDIVELTGGYDRSAGRCDPACARTGNITGNIIRNEEETGGRVVLNRRSISDIPDDALGHVFFYMCIVEGVLTATCRCRIKGVICMFFSVCCIKRKILSNDLHSVLAEFERSGTEHIENDVCGGILDDKKSVRLLDRFFQIGSALNIDIDGCIFELGIRKIDRCSAVTTLRRDRITVKCTLRSKNV